MASGRLITLCLVLVPFCYAIMTSDPIRRQGTGAPFGSLAEELLPPPALSASFPTLRPRKPLPPPQKKPFPVANNNNIGGIQQPPRDLVPPFSRPSLPNAPPRRPPPPSPPKQQIPVSAPPPQSASLQNLPLLPPIEIPPERPLTDNEILLTLVPKESSFIPTTGQGAATPSLGISIPGGAAPAPPTPVSQQQGGNNSTVSSSVVRFPSDSESSAPVAVSPPLRNCPPCECTNEVDYICASNGVLYLNSCSFDCATFCDPEIRKVELEMCASRNQQNRK